MTTSNTVTKNDLASVLDNVLPIQGTDLTQAGIEAFLSGLDAENLNGNVHFSSICTPVTLPFTPPTNGLLLTEMRASSAGRTYVTYSNATPGIVDGVLGASTYCTGVSFVTKDNQVTQTDSYNLQSIQWRFVPLDIKLSSEREISTEADWVIENGTSGIWTYRKWNSGIAECWGNTTKSVTGTSMTAPFSGYNYDCGYFTFPTNLFTSTPTITVNGKKNGNYTCVSYVNPTSTQVAVELQSSVSGTDTCYIHIYAVGTWK